jgi:hypothetical protein
MIAFGTAVSDRALYGRHALPSIERLAEPDSIVLTRHGYDSIQEPYNELLAEAAAIDDLEALVLLHQDLELTDESLLPRARSLLEDARTGLIGVLGWRRTKVHRWVTSPHHFGRSVAPGMSFHHSPGPDEVDLLDGVVLVLAPWVVRLLRFDERLAPDFHGYDIDFSMRVRAAGGRAICIDVPYVHHMAKPWRDREEWVRGATALAAMWEPSLRPGAWAGCFDWKSRGAARA